MQVVKSLLYGGEFDFIVNQYRLPRIFLAIGVGAGLGISGVLVQGIIRNPLASPDLMGISAGAGFVATALLVYQPGVPLYLLSISAMSGGLIVGILIILIAKINQPTPARLALVGISVSVFISSGIDLLLIIHPVEINTAMVWLTGSLWGRNWQHVPFIWWSLIVLVLPALWLAWRLDIMGLGKESAEVLGIQPAKVQVLALIIAILLASISVSICGTISFVGLLAPHMARLLFGHSHRFLLPAAAFLGALLVLVADILARGIQPPIELPVGIITSLIGAPYFIFLLHRYKGW